MSVVANSTENPALTAALLQVAEAIKNIRYGSIEIVIHEGRIVQIERREKMRINSTK